VGERATLQTRVYLGLLRGVNVGGNNRLPMSELRSLFVSLGFENVRTLIQSGNVIFQSSQVPMSSSLESAIAERFGISTDVVLRTASDLEVVVHDNPFPTGDAARVYVGFMAGRPSTSVVSALDELRVGADEFVVSGTEIYLYLSTGMGQSKLPSHLTRRIKIPITMRNWNTVKELAELAAS